MHGLEGFDGAKGKNKEGINRRSFLMGAAAGVGSLAGVSAGEAAEAAKSPEQLEAAVQELRASYDALMQELTKGRTEIAAEKQKENWDTVVTMCQGYAFEANDLFSRVRAVRGEISAIMDSQAIKAFTQKALPDLSLMAKLEPLDKNAREMEEALDDVRWEFDSEGRSAYAKIRR